MSAVTRRTLPYLIMISLIIPFIKQRVIIIITDGTRIT